MTPPRRPEPFDPREFPDPLHVEPEPVEPSPGSARWVARQPGYLEAARPKRYRLVPNPPRRGCSVLGYLALAAVVLVGSGIAAPRPAPHPTVVVPRDLSGLLVDASDPAQGGAPHIPGPSLDRDHVTAGHDGAPQPVGELGTALVGGWATWCEPTATRCQAWAPPALLGATPGFAGDPFEASVCADVERCVQVTVVSACACGDRHGRPTVIDLSPAAFERLAPLGHGLVRVTVEWPVQLPATDVEP